MVDSKRRNFIYKLATFTKETGDKFTLQELLEDAVGKVPIALDRAENPDGTEYRFLNYAHPHMNWEKANSLFGCEFLAFEKGADQSTIKLDPTAKEVDVNAITAQTGEEFLGGGVYFGAVDNHVVLIQARGLRALDLEKYLNWFLITKTGVLSVENRVRLADHIPTKHKGKIKDVKGIEIEAPIHLQPVISPADDENISAKRAEKSIAVRLGGKGWDAVKSLFGDGFDLPKELNIDDLTHAPRIDVKVFLSWRGTKEEDDQDFLGSIAKNMSHVDDEFEYTIHTRTGKIGKKDFKLFQAQNFKWNKGQPKFDDLFPKMAQWLASLIESGKVEA